MEVGLNGKHLNPILFSVIIAVLSIVVFLLWRSTFTTKTDQPPTVRCRRIRDIPIATSKEDLERLLRTCLPKDSRIDLTFVQSSPQAYMATVNSIELPTSFPYTVDEDFVGITPVFDSKDASIEYFQVSACNKNGSLHIASIVSVPGLGAHPISSFKGKGGDRVWIRDFLPVDIPSARILVYGYDTKVVNSTSKYSIKELAMAFLSSITAFRAATETNHRPLIFVAHSLGGLLVKEALSIAGLCEPKHADPRYNDFLKSSYALMFFGVPHLGLRNELLRGIVTGQLNEQLIHDLVVDKESQPTPFWRTLKEEFTRCCEAQEPPFEIISYYEQRQTPTIEMRDGTISRDGEPILMVTQDSACGIGPADKFHKREPLDTDHPGLVKFSNQSDNDYVKVKERMKTLVKHAPGIVSNRFASITMLSPDEKCHWDDLNVPHYANFKITKKVSKPAEGTLQWLITDQPTKIRYDAERLQRKDFVKWRDSKLSCILLVTAPPGQGKSVLSNFVVDYLIERPVSPRQKVIYHFCNIKNDEGLRTASSIVRALIVQLCEDRRLFQKLPNRFQNKDEKKEFFSASLEDLWAVFSDLIVTDIYSCIYCIIDGLDVYTTEMHDLLESLNEPFSPTYPPETPCLKLFCTSRPQYCVTNATLSPMKILRTSEDDLSAFINARLKSFPERFTDPIKNTIRVTIMSRVERTFLWISIVLRELEGLSKTSPRRITEIIESLPKGLGGLYKSLVQKILTTDPEDMAILAWITYAKRPLRLSELEVAITVGAENNSTATSWKQCEEEQFLLDKKWIRTHLGTLVDVIDNTPFLIHQTLRDFLLVTDLWQDAKVQSRLKQPELLLGDVSMTYLAFEEFPVENITSHNFADIMDCDRNRKPFLSYAASFWHSHIHTADQARQLAGKLRAILRLPTSRLWSSGVTLRNDMERMKSVWGIAIYYDIAWLANMLLNDTPNGLFEQFTNVHFIEAARRSSLSLFRELLTYSRISVTEEVLEAAMHNLQNTKELMMLLFRERGSEVKITEKVFEAAARFSNREVMILLLKERRSEVKITQKVLEAAAWNQNGEVLMLLLRERDSEVEITQKMLGAAARFLNEEVLMLLLKERRSEVKITQKVLEAAALNQNGEVLMLLLRERDSEVGITQMILEAAARVQNEEVLMLLLRGRRSEVKITTKVLKAAAWNQNGEVLMLLLRERDSEVEITQKMLEAAARVQNEEMSRLSFEEGGSEGTSTEKVLEAAAANFQITKEVMMLLLKERGCEVKITENVLTAAARTQNEEVLMLLLEEGGSEVKITEKVIQAAAENYCNRGVMNLLLKERNKEMNSTEKVLKTAVENLSDREVMKLLLKEQGSEVNVTEKVLEAAAANSEMTTEVMMLLLKERGSEVKITEKALESATWYRNGKVLKLLLEEQDKEIKTAGKVIKSTSGNS